MKMMHSQGYTLPEILIVLIIVGIVSTSAFSGWSHWQQIQRLNETAQQLQRYLHGLRLFANWHNTEQRLWLQAGARWCLGSGPRTETACGANKRMQLLAPHREVNSVHLIGEPGFYGKRDVAKAGSIVFGDGALTWRVIISSRGRIRLCKTAPQQCQ